MSPKQEARGLSVGTFNIERFGYDEGKSHHRLPAALDWLLEQTPVPPDILFLPEGTYGLMDGQAPIRQLLVGRLAPHLEDGWYEPLFSSDYVYRRSHHLFLFLVNTAKVRPFAWHDPVARPSGARHFGWAEAEIFGHEVALCCEHWSGGEGREVFNREANRVSNQGNMRKAIIGGDFNSDSGWEEERHLQDGGLDWLDQCKAQDNLDKLEQKGWFNPETQRWEIDTRQLDKLRTIYGYRDMGEEWGDPTPTTNPRIGSGLRIDRIFRSVGFPAEVTAYAVRQPPRELSDHAYVFGTYRVPVLSTPAPDIFHDD